MMLLDKTIAEQVQHARHAFGWINLSQSQIPLGILQVSGADAGTFLQAQTTSDVLTLQLNAGQPSALLDRKAHIDACFDLYQVDNKYWIIAEKKLLPKIQKRLETYIFTEDVQFSLPDKLSIIAIQGPDSEQVLYELLDLSVDLNLHAILPTVFHQQPLWIICKQAFLEKGYYLVADTQVLNELTLKLSPDNKLSDTAWQLLLLEAGMPLYEQDYDNDTLLPATGLEQVSVSYTKGCYQGQEVVAKVRTYGSVGKVLTGLVFETSPPSLIELNTPVVNTSGKELGSFKRNGLSPTLGKYIAMAYLNREARVPGITHTIQLNNETYEITVQLLPFYSPLSSQQKANQLYDEALDAFAHDREAEAELLLRKVIQLEPAMASAYESLGVILARRFDVSQDENVLDEAIALMQKLNEVDPDEVMAHTNLSMFYLKKGWKELAEEEKAKATVLGFKLVAKQSKAQVNLEAEKQKQLENKYNMFLQVLDFDVDDPLANYGLGQVLLDMNKPAEAIPYLQKSVARQANHTLSYLALGQAFEATQQLQDAQKCYQQGLEVASRKGDLMPLKQLQQALEKF